jgi:iron complex outermembrane receptor protein
VDKRNEIVVTGSRTAPRTNTTTSYPARHVACKDLTSQQSSYILINTTIQNPSFNTVQTPVNDATSLMDMKYKEIWD